MKKTMALILGLALTLSIAGCGKVAAETNVNSSRTKEAVTVAGSGNEDYYAWDGNTITGLSESGLQQTELVFPARCEIVADHACKEAPVLKKVSFENPDTVIEQAAFFNCEALSSVELPSNLQTLTNAFNMTAVTDIVIPGSVKIIEKKAFFSCSKLTSVTFGTGLEEIGDSAFWRCELLSAVSFPDTLKKIGKEAFYQCSSLETITFSEGLEEIGESAFDLCSALTSIKLPEGLTSIGKSTFATSPYLAEVYLPSSLEEIPGGTFPNLYDLNVFVKAGSWADIHFDEFSRKDPNTEMIMFVKNYY